MTHPLKPTHLILCTLLIAANASSKATATEYRKGTVLCTPTTSRVERSPITNKLHTFFFAPASSCRCEQGAEDDFRWEYRVNKQASLVTVTLIDKTGERNSHQYRNCKVLSSTEWDCSYPADLHWKIIARASSGVVFSLTADHNEIVRATIDGPETYGSCFRREGWSLRGLIGK